MKLASSKLDLFLKMYKESISNPEGFWAKHGKRVSWIKEYTYVKDVSFDKDNLHIRWFYDGTLNACYNCVDRHIENGLGDKSAIIWEPNTCDGQDKERIISYSELKSEVCRIANVMKHYGIKKGDVVTLYLPMIPETIFAMLACARIGAIHSVVFAGFSSQSLSERIKDANSKFVITADGGYRGNKTLQLKEQIDKALELTPIVKRIFVFGRTGETIPWKGSRDVWMHEAMLNASEDCPCEEMNAEDPLFILYTSGSTGTPKGVVHTTGGYLVYSSMTQEYVFNHRKEDIFWCTADVGWITGHSYIVYSPLCNGTTTLMFEGIPNYPNSSRCWEICDKYKVSTFYTAPTVIRMLKREGESHVKKTSRASLKVLGSVGEPIQQSAWNWYHDVVGEGKCPVVDTWWQTEGGGIMIAPLANTTPLKSGSATLPFFGVKPAIVDNEGNEVPVGVEGNLVIEDSWPGQARGIFKNDARFLHGYFSTFPGKFFSGDGAVLDNDGYYWITGRVDDIINVSGHRISTASIECTLCSHPAVAEACVVGFPHDIKGQGICAYVVLKEDSGNEDIALELRNWVRTQRGAIEMPDRVTVVEELPKTRSGKIIRRIIRKLTEDPDTEIPDDQALANRSAINAIKKVLIRR